MCPRRTGLCRLNHRGRDPREYVRKLQQRNHRTQTQCYSSVDGFHFPGRLQADTDTVTDPQNKESNVTGSQKENTVDWFVLREKYYLLTDKL